MASMDLSRTNQVKPIYFSFLGRKIDLVDSREDRFSFSGGHFWPLFNGPIYYKMQTYVKKYCQDIAEPSPPPGRCQTPCVGSLFLHSISGPFCIVAWLNWEDLIHCSPCRLTLARAEQSEGSHTWEVV